MNSSSTESVKESVTKSVTKKVYWNVPNFSQSFFTEYETGQRIVSESFSVSSGNEMSTEWFLTLCPNGMTEELKSNVGLFLGCGNAKETEFDFTVKYNLGVKKDNGEDCFISTAEIVRSKEELKESPGYGKRKFMSHENLFKEENGYVVGGKLVILVELTVEVEIAKPPPKIARCFCSDFEKMFENEALSDFELKTSDGKVLKAHKAIIAGRSPVFYAMLTTDMEEAKQGSAKVPDFDSTVMTEILRFIYYNEVERLSEIAPKLIYAAEKYQLEELKDICLQEMTSSLQVGNAVKFLKIVYRVSDAEDLFEKCLDLIVNNYPKVSQGSSWKELPKKLMSKIIDSMCEPRYTLNI